MAVRVLRAGQSLTERRAFAEVAGRFLARDEAANNQQLAVLDHLSRGRMADVEVEMLRAVPEGGGDGPDDTLSVVVRTPPYNALVCVGGTFEQREPLLADMLTRGVDLPGFNGRADDASEAAAWWAARTGRSTRVAMRLGVYRLTEVSDKPRAGGVMRLVTEADRDMVLEWFDGFNEATNNALRSPAEAWASFNGGDFRRLYLWEVDGVPVSVAGLSGRTPNGRRIGPVYTPPEARKRGYAEALVADLCRSILAAGSRFCFLFTDLDNPTSNHVYRDVGFHQIQESAEVELVAQPTT